MTNREKYKDEIINYNGKDFCDFCEEKILKSFDITCWQYSNEKDKKTTYCCHCRMLQSIWLEEEYTGREIDWDKVPLDTPVYVSDHEDFSDSVPCYYAGLNKNEKTCEAYPYSTFEAGATSFSGSLNRKSYWKYIKLADKEDEKKYTKNKE